LLYHTRNDNPSTIVRKSKTMGIKST
jgi:hypothetical protein